MERFLQVLYDRFAIMPDEDNVVRMDTNTLVFLGEAGDKITLLCPCFPVPTDQMDLLELLSLNCRSEINYCAAEGIILAKLTLCPEESFEDMVHKFNFYLYEIAAAREAFGHVRPE
ncbi:hypothetical protein ACL2XP_03850 [Sodalis sp. RH21]|uniref:hypothetical protein n=1 Tax=Sodalis sp. RH21 TaxID=3394336 RepID=UPI0039B52052